MLVDKPLLNGNGHCMLC